MFFSCLTAAVEVLSTHPERLWRTNGELKVAVFWELLHKIWMIRETKSFSRHLFHLLGVFECRSSKSCLTSIYINMS